MQPFSLNVDDGTMVEYGIPFLIKLGECSHGRGIAMVRYTARHGEEPPEHVHVSEDEVFYVIRGRLTFVCGEQIFPTETGGTMVLPAGIPHTYRVADNEEAVLLAITYPVQKVAHGWGGFVADMEQL